MQILQKKSKLAKFNIKKSLPTEKGFSLIEIIIAIGMISTGIVSIINILGMNLQSEIRNKNKIIAIYLAQESIEAVRETRDDNWFKSIDWLSGIVGDNTSHTIAIIVNDSDSDGDINEDEFISSRLLKDSPSAQEKKVYLHKTENFYVQSDLDLSSLANFDDTGFTRVVEVKSGAGSCGTAECLQIISTVSYHGDSIAKITSYLYKWREGV